MADGYVPNRELIELIQRVCKQFMNSFQPRPKRGRRVRRGGGGNATTNLTAFAVAVDDEFAVLLNELMQARGKDDAPLIIDENETGFDAGKLDAVKIAVSSAHTDSGFKLNDRLRVFATVPIVPGAAADPKHPTWAIHVDGSSYWEGHGSFGNGKVLSGQGGNALYRTLVTGSPEIDGTGSGACNATGGVNITIDVTSTGGPFVVPFPN